MKIKRFLSCGRASSRSAASVGDVAEPGEILASSTVKDLAVGSNVRFTDKGEKALKGVPDPWRVYVVAD